jgi:hypothetical protein
VLFQPSRSVDRKSGIQLYVCAFRAFRAYLVFPLALIFLAGFFLSHRSRTPKLRVECGAVNILPTFQEQ